MKKELLELKASREKSEGLKKKYNVAHEAFAKSQQPLIEEMAKTAGEIDRISAEVRLLAVKEYTHTGNKTLEYGVGIRITKSFLYDQKQALSWAKKHDMALGLDKKEFEKIAKSTTIDFVKIEETATATIPKEIKIEEEKENGK